MNIGSTLGSKIGSAAARRLTFLIKHSNKLPSNLLYHLTLGGLCMGMLTSCGADNNNDTPITAERAASSNSPYQFANLCFQLETDNYVVQRAPSETHYSLSDVKGQATPFFFKPTDLSQYMLFDETKHWLSAHDSPARTDTLDDRVEWSLFSLDNGEYVLQSASNGQWLSANEHQLLFSNDERDAAHFSITTTEGCAEFPEASTNASGIPARGEFEDGAVWGIADVHAHLFGTLAFGGNIIAGDVFHPLGITKALGECSVEHGKKARLDLTGFVTSGDEVKQISRLPWKLLFGQSLHKTEGYPDFKDWPSNTTTTHQIAYYKWLERAYLGGLRFMVNLVVESGPLCLTGRALSRSYAPTDPNYQFDDDAVCNGTVSSEKQIQATYDLVDYIDAQSGGPGKGWLRIVDTPEQARDVIKNKKLALIFGSETPDLFSCIDGVEGGRAECSTDYIDQRLDEYYNKGIRTVFPVHHYDNDFGGALVFNPIIEIAKVIQDGELFHYDACDESDYDPILAIKIPQLYYLLFPNVIRDLPLFPFVPNADGYCNRQGTTSLGTYLMEGMMKRGMLIETAHMSPKMKTEAIELAEFYDYPLIDTHIGKAWTDFGKVEETRYLSLGGIRAPLPNRNVSIDAYNGVRKNCNNHTSQDLAIQLMGFSDRRVELGLDRGAVFGTDMHGMVQQSYPRFGVNSDCDEPQENAVHYPFTSFDGAVTFEKQVTGQRIFDFNIEGTAHIGLLPDLIQDMRNQGMSDEYLESFFRGAESYLQTWEKAQQRSKALR